jgi:hypothetical protein
MAQSLLLPAVVALVGAVVVVFLAAPKTRTDWAQPKTVVSATRRD